MRKALRAASILVFFFTVGCGSDNTHDADFQGEILEVREDKIVVGEDDVDPEASYPTYDILIDDQTEWSGEIDSFEDLELFVRQTENPIVHVWVNDKGENNEVDKRVARKVNVGKE